MRVLLRRFKQQNWQFDRPVWRIDQNGVGMATYCARGPERSYTLVVFAHELSATQRSDRVIAEAWDATFTLFDGEPNSDDIQRLQQNVPRQEAGRISEKELTLSRANRSVRLFQYVVDRLANGQQPSLDEIEPVGYLMRTTAVYGSGKFGAADRNVWAERPEFKGSFQPELLSVWLIRSFTLDLVEHMARMKDPAKAVPLEDTIRRRIGVGNSTGLGMAPFLVTHPALIHSWILARETALQTVRSLQSSSDHTRNLFLNRVQRAEINAAQWSSAHPYQVNRIQSLRDDFTLLGHQLREQDLTDNYPWDRLYLWAEQNLSVEGQEQLVSLLLEPHGDLVDQLADEMCFDEATVFHINGKMTLRELNSILAVVYGWAIKTDFSEPDRIARVWYVSEEKLEPRLGERFDDANEYSLEPYEQALAPGRDAANTHASLQDWPPSETVAAFLMQHPEHRQAVRRAQLVNQFPYAEIQDNTIDAHMLPIDMLRCKLSFFGATKFDPRSDRWVRITLFQGAPFPSELDSMDPDDLAYPPLLPH